MMNSAINSMGENVKETVLGKDDFKLAVGHQHGDIGLEVKMCNSRSVIDNVTVDLGNCGR